LRDLATTLLWWGRYGLLSDARAGSGARDGRADTGIGVRWRNSDEFARLAFASPEMVPPGVVLVSEWRPDSGVARPAPAEVSVYGGAACKP
jgi:hypothetical protein